MKTLKYFLLVTSLTLFACDKFLEIVPKGQTTLSTLEDLEKILNSDYAEMFVGRMMMSRQFIVTNEVTVLTPGNVLINKNTENYGYLTCDAGYLKQLMELTSYDYGYSCAYTRIAHYNILIEKIKDVSGDETYKSQLVAEARSLRAYHHWYLVNTFAKAYDNAGMAAVTPGVPCVLKLNLETINPKATLEEVYNGILNDLNDEVLVALPDIPVNPQRAGKAFGYAVRAKVHLSMKNYTLALDDATKALLYNSTMEDRRNYIGKIPQRLPGGDGDIFFLESSGLGTASGLLTSVQMSREFIRNYEKGDIMRYYAKNNGNHTYYTEDEHGNRIKVDSLFINMGAGDSQPNEYDNVYKIEKMTSGSNDYYFNDAGIRVSDVLLVQAECQARIGNITEAMNTVNYLRRYRIHPDEYTELTASTLSQAMAHIMRVSKVENFVTFNNFFNLKRWNTEVEYKETITKTIETIVKNEGGNPEWEIVRTTFTITPDSPYWVAVFPLIATQNNPLLTQNFDY